MEVPSIETRRHESELGTWELVRGTPDPRLRGIVGRYEGYVESGSAAPVLRQEVPFPRVPLIVNFGAHWQIASGGRDVAPERHGSFVAGLSDTSAYVVAEGAASCLQVDFTPIGARMFFGVPMHELTNRVVAVEDLLGRDARLAARLEAAPTWEARFALLDELIAARVGEAPQPRPEIVWAWRALEHTNGSLPVGQLAERIGRSRRHLTARFREQVGLGPKTFSRVLRFRRAVELLQRGSNVSFAELAFECGYFDQSHLIRDFRAFAAATPTEFAQRFIPGGGVSAA
jgi:AraC-like DNA-binding protein